MKRPILKLRQECFGGTLFAPHTGLRTYLDQLEFETVARRNDPVAEELLLKLGMGGELHITYPEWLPNDNFSAPDVVFFEITRACNLRCAHCFNSSGIKLVDEASLKERLKIIQDLIACGVQEIRFTGGAPTRFRRQGQ